MKKVLLTALTIVLAIGISSPSYARDGKKDEGEKEQKAEKNLLKLSKKEKERLYGLGYTDKQIELLTPEEYEKEKNDYGEVVAKVTEYYRVQKGKKPEKVSKATALKEVKKYQEKIKKAQKEGTPSKIVYDDISETSWMEMETKVTKYTDDAGESTGEFRFKHDFKWLTEPFWLLTDVVAITHHDYFTYEDDSEYYKYYYDRYLATSYVDTRSVTDSTIDELSPEGGAFEVDLKSSDGTNAYNIRNHEGYMYYRTYLNDWDKNSANVYGHYIHAEGSITALTINLFTGQLSVGGMMKKSAMPNTGVYVPLP